MAEAFKDNLSCGIRKLYTSLEKSFNNIMVNRLHHQYHYSNLAGAGAGAGEEVGGQETLLVRLCLASYLISSFCFSLEETVLLNFRSGELENGLGLLIMYIVYL